MTVEQEILIELLNLTKHGPTDHSLVSRNTRTPTQTTQRLLGQLGDQNLLKLRGNLIEASSDQRVKIAVQAIKLGADFERVCTALEWKEFEGIATQAFEVNNYNVIRNLRFKEKGSKRWEIDLLALRQPLILSVDCKHWQHRWTRAPVVTMVEQQVERTRAFSEALPSIRDKIGLDGWKQAMVVPIILSLIQAPFKFHNNTPTVSVLQLQSFLNELPAYTSSLTTFRQNVPVGDKRITEYRQKPTEEGAS